MEPESTQPTSSSEHRVAVAPWWRSAVCCAVLLVLLAIVAAPEKFDEAGAQAHHRRAQLVEARIPYVLASWVGTDVPVPTSATDLLKPNAMVSREYRNVQTGESVQLLIVQCADARDLSGHYPPVCYPAHGLVAGTSLAKTWSVGGHDIDAMRYTFIEQDFRGKSMTVVDNFMVLPTGRFGRDMESIWRVGKDPRLRHFGAAQVQMLTAGSMSDQRRDEVFEEIAGSIVPMIEPFLAKVSAQ